MRVITPRDMGQKRESPRCETPRRVGLGSRAVAPYLGIAGALALAVAYAGSAVAAVTPELYFKVHGAKITKAIAFKSTSGPSRLWYEVGGFKLELECEVDHDLGFFEPVGLDNGVLVHEECEWVSPPTPTSVSEKCHVSSNWWFLSVLVYKKASAQILDLFEPPSGSTTFAVLKFEGAECSIAGNQPVKSKALATVSPERSEAKTGRVKFEAAENHEEQVPSEYTETENGATGTKASLTSAGVAVAYSSEDTVELLSGEEWGAF